MMDGATWGWIGGIGGGVIGMLGGILGTWASIRGSRTPQERWFMIQCAAAIWGIVLAFVGVPLALAVAGIVPLWWTTAALGPMWVVLAPMIVWMNRRGREVSAGGASAGGGPGFARRG